MVIIVLFTVATMVIGLVSSAIAWEFIIARNSTQKLPNTVYDSIDKFNISECSASDNLCTNYGGRVIYDKCQCICSQEKSTFGFYNGHWRCADNLIVRQHAGCEYTFERPGSKGEDNPIFTLPVLGTHGDNNYVGNIPNKTCKVIAENATFLKCDGTWDELTKDRVERKLQFQDDKLGTVYVGPYQRSSQADSSLDGRVIRIPIKCEGLTWNSSQCIAFKIKGKLTCTNFSGLTKRNVSWPSPVRRESSQTPPTSTTGKRKIKNSDDPTPSAAVVAGSVVGSVIFISLIAVIVTSVKCLRREKAKTNGKSNEGIEETETTGNSEVPETLAISMITPYAQFSGGRMMSTATNNPRQIEPYNQSLRQVTVTSQGANYVNRPVANADDSPYEIMNPLYQNCGIRKEVEPPYENIC